MACDEVGEARHLAVAPDQLADLGAAQVAVDEQHLLHLSRARRRG
jgi:hypothetical protein